MEETKRRAGTRWNSVVEKVWKDMGGNQEDILSIDKFDECKTEVKEWIRKNGKASAKKQGEGRGNLTDLRAVKRI